MIIQYAMARAASSAELADYVNEQICYGWQPYGSPFPREAFFYQALVKHE